jgi:YidC/Oxa1 family membrane protein insertase
VPNKSKNKNVKAANEKEENTAEMAAAMQQQMIFVMPIIMVVIAAQFPSGLALYWVVSNIFTIGQQYFVSGWGGLIVYYQRLVNKYGKN